MNFHETYVLIRVYSFMYKVYYLRASLDRTNEQYYTIYHVNNYTPLIWPQTMCTRQCESLTFIEVIHSLPEHPTPWPLKSLRARRWVATTRIAI